MYSPMPAMIEPQKIHGVRLPKRERVRSESVPHRYPINSETRDVADVMTPYATVGFSMPASLMCCGRRVAPLSVNAALLRMAKMVKATR